MGNVIMRTCAVFAAVCVFATGCATRSISNSEYPGRWGGVYYSGELHEYNLLSVGPDQPVTDDAIAAALENRTPLRIPRGSRVLLIQSGALVPDEPMQEALSQYYAVAPFSGIPARDEAKANYAGALRMAAVRGGYEYIVCYWGVLESAERDLVTKGVSWVPIVGYAVPDQTQEMRIRLRVIGMDVRTGQWAMVTPEAHGDNAVSARANRRDSDQAQVRLLKDKGYRAAAAAVVQAWGG